MFDTKYSLHIILKSWWRGKANLGLFSNNFFFILLAIALHPTQNLLSFTAKDYVGGATC